MSTPINNIPYLPTTRKFPQDLPELETEIAKSYVDTANAVNARIIGIFELAQSITGERWFSTNSTNNQTKRQTQRKVFQFSDASLTFAHGITGVTLYTRIWGAFTDGTIFYPLPYVNPTAANQVGVSVSATQVVVTKGGGAPVITSGIVVLEWLSQ